MDEGEIYLEPDFKVVSEKVYVKIYSFEKDKIIYTGSNPLTNGDHPVSWNPKAHLLVLESRRSGWVNPEMIYEDCEKFKGKYNICVKFIHPIDIFLPQKLERKNVFKCITLMKVIVSLLRLKILLNNVKLRNSLKCGMKIQNNPLNTYFFILFQKNEKALKQKLCI